MTGNLILLTMALFTIQLILEKEYSVWASSLARGFVKLAGVLCPWRYDEWWADLQYVQSQLETSGLACATYCLLGAPFLAFRQVVSSLQGMPLETLEKLEPRISVAALITTLGSCVTFLISEAGKLMPISTYVALVLAGLNLAMLCASGYCQRRVLNEYLHGDTGSK